MLKLLIADDERIIRETIFNIIDWKKHDIEVIGLCKNGIEAYDMILDGVTGYRTYGYPYARYGRLGTDTQNPSD